MTIELLPSFKTQAILDVHNHLATAKGTATLADWSKAKGELVGRIMKMATTEEIEAAIKATDDGPKPGTKGKVTKTKKAPKAKTEKKAKVDDASTRTLGVGAFIRELLAETPEMPALDVLAKVQKKWPGAKTSVACVGWYRSKMYKSGDLKKTAVAKARKTEAA
jgi:hypothetical protein